MLHRDEGPLQQAAQCWSKGEALEAGRMIFENLAPQSRPKWAADILKLVLQRSNLPATLFNDVLLVADHEEMWPRGHEVFDRLRDARLILQDLEECRAITPEEDLLTSILPLAELVAKVTYNATDPRDEFDEDSGWWIALCVKDIIDRHWNDDEFTAAAWRALSGSSDPSIAQCQVRGKAT